MSETTFEEYLIEEKMKMLSIVAFGCNKRAQTKLDKLLNEPFIYYEYFSSKPILKKYLKNDCKNIPVYALFLERVLRQYPFVPLLDDINSNNIDEYLQEKWKEINYKPKSRELIRKFFLEPVYVKFSETIVSWKVYEAWYNNPKEDLNITPQKLDLQKIPCKFLQREDPQDKISAFKDFLITCAPYLKHNINTLHYVCWPIASQEIFYGTLIFAHPDKSRVRDVLNTEVKKGKKVFKYLSDEVYLPVITLFENYWEEFVINEGLKEKEEEKELKIRILNFQLDNKNNHVIILNSDEKQQSLPLLFLNIDNSSYVLEKRLKFIWENRKDFLKNIQNKEKKSKLKKHLLFANYNVASPKMLQLVEKIVNLNLKKFDKSLPSALVIGAPGSGKDTLAKLIALFSEDYTKGDIFTINMASYKPDSISTPLLAGLDIDRLKVNGLFENLPEGQKSTLILDELNSLDIDAQGALLRILENGEIVPIGSIEPSKKELDVLVIGVMNEDPEKLTKESTLRQILMQEKLFGGALGEVLYEYVRNTRRLREDLYHRLIRGGKFEVPELEKRREDIPILFYVYAKGFAKPSKIEVDFNVYDILMSETINWPGNIRQLQTVVKKIVNRKIQTEISRPPKVEITRNDVENVLKDMKMLKDENGEI